MKYIISLNGKDYEVEVEQGEAMVVSVQDTQVAAPAASAPVAAAPVAAAPAAAAPVAAAPVALGSGEPVTSPMPGTIVKVVATVGSAVKKGETLVILEAMKMENEIVAPRDGVVGQIAVTSGKSVATGDVLVTLN